MSDPAPIKINCALISLVDNAERLLLPKVAVADVVGSSALTFQPTGPVWLLGFVDWHNHRVPALSYEALCGRPMPAHSKRSRLAVINSVGVHMENGLFALLSQGHPHLATLSEYALQPEVGEQDLAALCRARLGNTRAVIPDLETIELHLSDALSPTGS